MPLIAKSIKTGKRIDIGDFKDPSQIDRDDIICPYCEMKMNVRLGHIRVHHFYHRSECTTKYKSHPESLEHLFAKRYLSKEIKNIWKEYSDATIELEYLIKESNRIADIAVIFPSGWIVVHEIQLSPIDTRELNERTKDYLDGGVDVVWWLGKKADTKPNREWCLQNFGFSNALDFKEIETDPKYVFGSP